MQTLMAKLKAKRFRQIFQYLDQDQDGVIDLLDLTTGIDTATATNLCFVIHQPAAHAAAFFLSRQV